MATSKVLSIVLKATDRATAPVRKVIGTISSVTTKMLRVDRILARSARGMFKAITSLKGAIVAFAAFRIGSRLIGDLALVEEKAAEVATLVGDLGKQEIRELSEVIQDLAVEGGQTLEDEFRAAYDAISAGIPAEQLQEFLRTANKLAVGGVTNVGVAVDLLTSSLNAYDLAASHASDVSDVFFVTVRRGKTTVEELGRFIFQVAPAANAAGVGIDQVGASIAALTASGVPTRVATTQLRSLLLELGKAGTKANEEFRAVAGVGFREFIAAGGDVSEAMELIRERASGTGRAITDLFTSVEGGLAGEVLAGAGFDLLVETLGDMDERAGATERAFETMSGTLAFALRQVGTSIRTFRTAVLEGVRPAIGQALRFVRDVTGAIKIGIRAIRAGGEIGREAKALLALIFRDLAELGKIAIKNLIIIFTAVVFELLPVVAELVGRKFASAIFEALVGGFAEGLAIASEKIGNLTGIDFFGSYAEDVRIGLAEATGEIRRFFVADLEGAVTQLNAAMTEQAGIIDILTRQGFGELADQAAVVQDRIDSLRGLAEQMGTQFKQAGEDAKQAIAGVGDEIEVASSRVSSIGLFDSLNEGVLEWSESLQTTDQFVRSFVGNTINAFAGGLSNAIADVVTGARSMKDAFKDFALSTIRLITQMILQFLILRAISGVFGTAGQAAAGTNAAGGVVQGVRTGGLIGRGRVRRFASGGVVPGPQVSYDVTPALLAPGEFVLNRDAVQRIGLAALFRANRQSGGSGAAAGGGGSSVVFNQTVNIQGGGDVGRRAARRLRDETADALRHALRERPAFRAEVRSLVSR